jgi:hypothetical protein
MEGSMGNIRTSVMQEFFYISWTEKETQVEKKVSHVTVHSNLLM